MSDALHALARAAGVAVRWQDVQSAWHGVAAADLCAILAALGLPAGSAGEARDSLAGLHDARQLPPALLSADAGTTMRLPAALHGPFALRDEAGTALANAVGADGELRVPAAPGYYQLGHAAGWTTLAVAPAAPTPRRGRFGVAAQVPSLRSAGDGGLGSYAAAGRLAAALGRQGADALALSPVHALFAQSPGQASPYSPSSRVLANVLLVDAAAHYGEARLGEVLAGLGAAAQWRQLECAPLIDWQEAGALRLRVLRALHECERHEGGEAWRQFLHWRKGASAAVGQHASFEALQAVGGVGRDWRGWPAALRNAGSTAVAEFVRQHEPEVTFHCHLQWLAAQALAAAQAQARASGMRIGLVADLAVGCDPQGSDAWRQPGAMASGLSIGAPPDLLAPQGQAWGLATFSPAALRREGYAPFLEVLRAALAWAGGVRIDHVIGLQRLWLVPAGADAAHGAYVDYPRDDLLRLVALEAWRHDALVVGEDLGTVPEGFRGHLSRRGVAGMSVLVFERDGTDFLPLADWRRDALAMTSTHDLPPLAGWWCARDLDWRERLALVDGEALQSQRRARALDRERLAARITRDGGPVLHPDGPAAAFVDAAIAHVARAPSPLPVVPMEDLCGETEQPNLPGTTEGHPNWQRRMAADSAALLERADVAQRLALLRAARGDAGEP